MDIYTQIKDVYNVSHVSVKKYIDQFENDMFLDLSLSGNHSKHVLYLDSDEKIKLKIFIDTKIKEKDELTLAIVAEWVNTQLLHESIAERGSEFTSE